MGRETGRGEDWTELRRVTADAVPSSSSPWGAAEARPVREASEDGGEVGYPAEIRSLLDGLRHRFAYAELTQSVTEIIVDLRAPQESEMGVFRAMVADLKERGGGDIQRGLLLAWEDRTGERVRWPEPVADLWLEVADERARQFLERKAERICRDLDNPNPREVEVLQKLVDALRRHGGGDPARGLLAQLERDSPAPRAPWGERTGELAELRLRAEALARGLDAGHPNVAGNDRLAKRVKAEIGGVLRDMEHGVTEATADRVNGMVGNLLGVWAEWQCARERSVRGPVLLATRFAYVDLATGRESDVDVDVQDEGGRRWTEVKNARPFTTDSGAWGDLRRQAAALLQAAEQNPIGGGARRTAVEFRRGVTRSVAAALAGMGVEVIGTRAVERWSKERTWEW